MKKSIIFALALRLSGVLFGSPVLDSVEASMHQPLNGTVDIRCAVSDRNGVETKPVTLMRVDTTTGKKAKLQHVTLQGRPVTNGVTRIGKGTHEFLWDAAEDVGKGVVMNHVSIEVILMGPQKKYCVIDLSEGPNALHYPVSYLEEAPVNGWSEEYKATKLVMRRIPAGTFWMGSPDNESDREDDERRHEVTLTEDYWMGVFEVTQTQWGHVMGTNPSEHKGSARPVESVSYDDIRGKTKGAGWPTNGTVDASSFVGKVRARSGLEVDLPTEAQWEYACRAGTTTALNSGKTATNQNLKEVACFGKWYDGKDQHVPVGSYKPNAWGLYDMHGNVYEWCLDWYGEYPFGVQRDPKGATSGSCRVFRGGCWNYDAGSCRSAFRYYNTPSNGYRSYGFRLAAPAGL